MGSCYREDIDRRGGLFATSVFRQPSDSALFLSASPAKAHGATVLSIKRCHTNLCTQGQPAEYNQLVPSLLLLWSKVPYAPNRHISLANSPNFIYDNESYNESYVVTTGLTKPLRFPSPNPKYPNVVFFSTPRARSNDHLAGGAILVSPRAFLMFLTFLIINHLYLTTAVHYDNNLSAEEQLFYFS